MIPSQVAGLLQSALLPNRCSNGLRRAARGHTFDVCHTIEHCLRLVLTSENTITTKATRRMRCEREQTARGAVALTPSLPKTCPWSKWQDANFFFSKPAGFPRSRWLVRNKQQAKNCQRLLGPLDPHSDASVRKHSIHSTVTRTTMD